MTAIGRAFLRSSPLLIRGARPIAATAFHVRVGDDDFVRVIGSDQHADVHLRWLRHICDGDRTRERLLDSTELPDTIRMRDARFEDGVLRMCVVVRTGSRRSMVRGVYFDR